MRYVRREDVIGAVDRVAAGRQLLAHFLQVVSFADKLCEWIIPEVYTSLYTQTNRVQNSF